ncbi:MAG: hypothetical protein ABI721_05080 [Candidatus Dojkabacteria bacterium]
MKKLVLALSLVFIISPFFIPNFPLNIQADTGYSAWAVGGVAAVATTGSQNLDREISDGEGGIIVAWNDSRSISNEVYAQKINSAGAPQWTTNGVAIMTGNNDNSKPALISDGLGGAIITWSDSRSGNADIYAQRINRTGTVQWTANGVTISNPTGNQNVPEIISDGNGGAIITWYDFRAGVSNADVYVQRVNSAGTVQWTANGVQLTSIAGNQQTVQIVSDGTGGAIIAWEDGDVSAQRVNSAGAIQWTAGGIVISNATNSQSRIAAMDDGSGGAIFTWEDHRAASTDVYAQKINSAGTVQWTANGVAIANSADTEAIPVLTTDGSGGAIISWERTVSGLSRDIYAQRINSAGTVQWTANGLIVVTGTADQNFPNITTDLNGGAVIVWNDWARTPTSLDLYAQRINSSGSVVWNTQGVLISGTTTSSDLKTITSSFNLVGDSSGQFFMSWKSNNTSGDIYTQKILNLNRKNVSKFADSMTRINETTTATHTIYFVNSSGIFAGQNIKITFPGAFTFGASFDFGEIALAQGSTNDCATATFTSKTIAASASGTTWGATYSSSVVTIVSATDFIPEDRCIRVILSSTTGSNTITNPTISSDTVYNIDVIAGSEQGQLAVIILNDLGTPDSDQIQIQGNVGTAISLDLDTVNTNCNNSTETGLNTVNLGRLYPNVVTLSGTTINFICIDAASNAGLGMQIFARSNRSNATGALVSGANTIVSATANLNSTASGYGLRVSSVGTPTTGTFTAVSPFNNGTPGSVGLLPGILSSAAKIVNSSAPVQTGISSRIAIEVAAKASGVTPSGSYSDIISFTALVNF